jgi:Putative zinc-finger
MRHIPEEELHAYLDQGLSRTQCVEIESHLADCSACRALRDQIAALRDRTTALLARLAPPRRVPPTFESLGRRAAEQASERRRRIHQGAWAASLMAAVGLGWMASSLVGPRTAPPPTPRIAVQAPPVVESPNPPQAMASDEARKTPRPAPASPASPRPKTARRAPSAKAAHAAGERKAVKDSIRAAMLAVLDPAPAVELTQLDNSSSQAAGEFDGMWRTVSWDGARAEAGERLPHIDGLPVLKVQVQSGDQGRQSIMVIAQQLSSGQVIQTIEGPAADVSQLLARHSMADVDSVILTDSAGQSPAGDHAMAMQLGGDRMLAITGALPSDSLRAMIRRLNAEMRSK